MKVASKASLAVRPNAVGVRRRSSQVQKVKRLRLDVSRVFYPKLFKRKQQKPSVRGKIAACSKISLQH